MKAFFIWGIVMLLSVAAQSNNLKITRQPSVTPSTVVSNTAVIDFTIEWENSWRDDYNWDAVYVFFKCKRKSEKVWNHVTLMDAGHVVTSGYSWWVNKFSTAVNVAQGIFIYPSAKTNGKAVVNVKAKWSLVAPANYTQAEFRDDEIEYVATCIEMVYIPKGIFCLGDGKSVSGFKSNILPILPEWDLLDESDPKLKIWTNDDITSTANGAANYWNYPPINVANRINENSSGYQGAWYTTIGGGTKILYIDLGEEKTVRYFGISSGTGHPNNRPASCTLYGSNSLTGGWTALRTINAQDWSVYDQTYPVPVAIKVAATPKPYRYYYLACSGGTQPYILQNLAMTEVDVEKSWANFYIVTNQGITFNTTTDLYADDGETWSGILPVGYPSGYEGFYVMKYEITQEQYVRFLNKLTLTQQQLRTIGSSLTSIGEGQYVYGSNRTSPTARNGIILAVKGEDSYLFANDLNRGDEIAQNGDGQTLACNYLSVDDMLAYADWAALRPLSEAEYEKMSRPLFPDVPRPNEWPWNSSETGSVKIPANSTLLDAGKVSEKVPNANVNAGNRIAGPVRVGSFAKGASTQQEAGASYWGVMDLAGNLAEMCYNMNVSKGRPFTGNLQASHGNGILAATGNTDVSTGAWPHIIAAFAVKGGSYLTTTAYQMQVSNRSFYAGRISDLNMKSPDLTFRLGYSFTYPYRVVTPAVEPCTTYLTLQNGARSSGNNVAVDNVCDNADYTIKGTPLYSSGTTLKPLDGKVTYTWFVSEDNTTSWRILYGENGQDLTYRFRNRRTGNRTVYVKRLTTTPTLASETFYVRLTVINTFNAVSRLQDTIRENNQALGFLFETGSNATYVWRWLSGGKVIQTTTTARQYDYYCPQRSDFANRSGQVFTIRCEATVASQCVIKQDVEVYVAPRPTTGIPSDAITINKNLPTDCGGMMQDMRDGKVYGTTLINNKCWMAENLRWVNSGVTYTFQKDDPDGSKYGVMYQWTAALHANACPEGWRMPLKSDYDQLNTYLNRDGRGMVGPKLKAGNYWNVTNAIANRLAMGQNSSGFGAVAAGIGNAGGNIGVNAYFIASTDAGTGQYTYMLTNVTTTFTLTTGITAHRSVRCIKK